MIAVNKHRRPVLPLLLPLTRSKEKQGQHGGLRAGTTAARGWEKLPTAAWRRICPSSPKTPIPLRTLFLSSHTYIWSPTPFWGGKGGGAFLFIACQRRVKFLLLPSLTQCLAGTVPPAHAPWGCGTAVLCTQLPTPHARGPLLSPLHPP